ncbi:MAG: FAD-binding oxidoreductase [Bacteroidia bacterium]|nr:FAD-binding oxidoreductase [Bacteroidia bacterium]
MIRNVENIIVGGGIAGTWMAYQFVKASKSFVLIDAEGHSKSSFVAAGIFNPIIPAKQKISYKADEIYPFLSKKYHDLEGFIHEKVLHKDRISYIIDSLKELNDWAAQSENHIFKDFVIMRNERIADHVISDFGVLDIQETGWIDIPLLITSFRKKLIEMNAYLNEDFSPNLLHFDEKGFDYKNLRATNIIFCQGTAALQNPFTANIGLKPAKGEVITIKSNETIQGSIPQNGVFLVPIGNDLYRVGSNCSWSNLDFNPTSEAKNEIINKLTKWYKAPFDIVDQIAGVRPASLDRRPIVGQLNFHSNAFVLNGFGSKGVALAPFYSKMLYSNIYDETPIDNDVDVSRFK